MKKPTRVSPTRTLTVKKETIRALDDKKLAVINGAEPTGGTWASNSCRGWCETFGSDAC